MFSSLCLKHIENFDYVKFSSNGDPLELLCKKCLDQEDNQNVILINDYNFILDQSKHNQNIQIKKKIDHYKRIVSSYQDSSFNTYINDEMTIVHLKELNIIAETNMSNLELLVSSPLMWEKVRKEQKELFKTTLNVGSILLGFLDGKIERQIEQLSYLEHVRSRLKHDLFNNL